MVYVETKEKINAKPVCKCGIWFNTKVNCPVCYVKARVKK